MFEWFCFHPARARRAMLVAGVMFARSDLPAQSVDTAARSDSLRVARERGAAAGAAVNTAGWLVTGILLPPVIVAGAWTAAASDYRRSSLGDQ